MSDRVNWSFDADYFTFCNCDWGCPCNFNAKPTQGNCDGVGAWRVRKGSFGGTQLDGVVFAIAYFFPGLIEQGNGTTRLYIDEKTSPEQTKAIESIFKGEQGGGIFEILAKLSRKIYPTKIVKMYLDIDGPKASLKVGDLMEAESDVIKYPDGTEIYPTFTLPHGIEFKQGLATNAKTWWIRDEDMLASHENKYGVVTTVKFTHEGCVG